MSGALAPFQPEFEPGATDEMRARLHAARWPRPAGPGGWERGADLAYLRELCAWWADEYDPAGLLQRLTAFPSLRRRGLHLWHARAEGGGGAAVLLIHGWPGAPLEFSGVVPRLLAAGHDVVVPSLPGYGFSAVPDPPLNAAGTAARLIELMAALGYERFAVQGGDWGAVIGARIAFERPDRVLAFHTNGPGLLPLPPDLGEPPLDEDEADFAQRAQRWRLRHGYHLAVHGAAADSLGPALEDSPAGLAAWLVPKYRAWSDCDGEVESRFSRPELCDLLTFYWATRTVTSALRLYAAEAADRWRLAPGERIEVPCGVADFPAEIVRPPQAWSERILADLRRWTEMPSGGHFAAHEEPGLLADDLLALLAEVG